MTQQASRPIPHSALRTSQSTIGWALALFSTFASSIVTPLVRGAVVGGMDPITLLFMRLGLALLLLTGTLLLTEPQRLKVDRRGLWALIVVGLVAGVEICCFFWSLAFVDASMTAMIKATQPLVVLLMLTWGGERFTRRDWGRLWLAMGGVYLLVGLGAQGRVAPFGLLLLFLSLLLYAGQLVLTQWWLPGYPTQTITLYLTAMMTLVIACWWWVQGAQWQAPTFNDWAVILVLAVVSTYLARLALYASIRRIGSGQIALLWPLQTLVIIVLSVLFLHERLTLIQWAGGLLILLSTLLAIERPPATFWRPRSAAAVVVDE